VGSLYVHLRMAGSPAIIHLQAQELTALTNARLDLFFGELEAEGAPISTVLGN
jgi:hypothetical protein